MPRNKKQQGTKSAAIRELLGQNPNMPVKEIVTALAAKGMKATPNLVYFIKAQTKARKRRAKRLAAMANGQRAGVANPAELVLQVRRLAGQAGGMKNLKQLVDVLAE